MLENLDHQIRDCLARMQDCVEHVRKATDARERKEWLWLERKYLNIARSIELSRRLRRLSSEGKAFSDHISEPTSREDAVGKATHRSVGWIGGFGAASENNL
jgi:hypothetical protein